MDDLFTRRRPDPLHLRFTDTEEPEHETPPAWLGASMLTLIALVVLGFAWLVAPYVEWWK